MPWNMKDFPASMKNLDKLTRKKAIDIANALLDEGYPDSRAITIAIDQAKDWYENASESERRTFEKEKNPSKSDKHDTNPRAGKLLDSDVIVEYAEEQWIVKSKGAKKASNHFDTKKEAIEKGKQVAQNKESTLVIYKKDGTKEKEIDY
ncbi:DUF2188 domain-containing protein [Enterococcus faecium]|uniref:DUF2188 domain-containing protein n=1 Tax=Enterococcus faecium TaxID=1352 RepID=UPI0035D6E9B5